MERDTDTGAGAGAERERGREDKMLFYSFFKTLTGKEVRCPKREERECVCVCVISSGSRRAARCELECVGQ